MKIAVLGTGTVGRTLATGLVDLGHDVTVGTRDPARTDWNAPTPLAAFADAIDGAEVVVNALQGTVCVDVLSGLGDALVGVVLIDVTNPLDFSAGMPPTLFVKDTDSLAEQLQRALPDTQVVKTLNTVTADLMVNPGLLAEPGTVFVSGDDAGAKATVTEILGELGHTDVLDLGDISSARGPEMYLSLWLRVMPAVASTHFTVRVVR